MYQSELEGLTVKYKEREKDSLTHTQVPDEKYLCIRLDGFNATSKFLKNELTNNNFNTSLLQAHKNLFWSFRHHLNYYYTSSIVCSFIANDEVSIILNKDNDNYNKRVMKLCSLFAGVLSSSMSLNINRNNDKIGIVAFDSRPIILNSQEEIIEYLRYRYLVAKRYAYWKALRLNKFNKVYEDDVKYNIDVAIQHVIDRGEEKDAKKVLKSYKLLIPELKKNPKCITFKVDNELMTTPNLNKKISTYLQYLHSEPRKSE